jgi:hypothetical protein
LSRYGFKIEEPSGENPKSRAKMESINQQTAMTTTRTRTLKKLKRPMRTKIMKTRKAQKSKHPRASWLAKTRN